MLIHLLNVRYGITIILIFGILHHVGVASNSKSSHSKSGEDGGVGGAHDIGRHKRFFQALRIFTWDLSFFFVKSLLLQI